MKIIIAVFSFLIYSSIQGQGLKNSEWIEIKVERKDGSKIINRRQSDSESIKFYFRKDSVLTSTNGRYLVQQKYSVKNNILKVGDYLTYKIDTLNDVILNISQVSQRDLPDDKLNRFLFINSDYIFDYLKQTHQLTMISDSVVQCSNQFSPTYLGDIDALFASQFNTITENKTLTGSFIISADGNIKSVQIDVNSTFSKKEIEKVINSIDSTSGY